MKFDKDGFEACFRLVRGFKGVCGGGGRGRFQGLLFRVLGWGLGNKV